MIFFRLFDWDRDGAITEPDINNVINSNEHSILSDELKKETLLYFCTTKMKK